MRFEIPEEIVRRDYQSSLSWNWFKRLELIADVAEWCEYTDTKYGIIKSEGRVRTARDEFRCHIDDRPIVEIVYLDGPYTISIRSKKKAALFKLFWC